MTRTAKNTTKFIPSAKLNSDKKDKCRSLQKHRRFIQKPLIYISNTPIVVSDLISNFHSTTPHETLPTMDEKEFTNNKSSQSSSPLIVEMPVKTSLSNIPEIPCGTQEDLMVVSVDLENSVQPLRDWPHPRHLCTVYPLKTDSSHSLYLLVRIITIIVIILLLYIALLFTQYCPLCFCYLCDAPVKECSDWEKHCETDGSEASTKMRRQLAIQSNPPILQRGPLQSWLCKGSGP